MEAIVANLVDPDFPLPSKDEIDKTVEETKRILTRQLLGILFFSYYLRTLSKFN